MKNAVYSLRPLLVDSRDLLLNDKFIGFVGEKSKKAALLHCPMCRKENYHMAVLDGYCAWCSWRIDKEAVASLVAMEGSDEI